MGGAGGEAEQRAGVLRRSRTVLGERLGATAAGVQRAHPVGEPGDKRREARLDGERLGEHRLGAFVAAVGADCRVHVAAQPVEERTEIVEGGDRFVGGAAVGFCGLAQFDGADPMAVEDRNCSIDVGTGLFHGGPELAGVE